MIKSSRQRRRRHRQDHHRNNREQHSIVSPTAVQVPAPSAATRSGDDGGWLVVKKRGRDDDAIERDRKLARQQRRQQTMMMTGRTVQRRYSNTDQRRERETDDADEDNFERIDDQDKTTPRLRKSYSKASPASGNNSDKGSLDDKTNKRKIKMSSNSYDDRMKRILATLVQEIRCQASTTAAVDNHNDDDDPDSYDDDDNKKNNNNKKKKATKVTPEQHHQQHDCRVKTSRRRRTRIAEDDATLDCVIGKPKRRRRCFGDGPSMKEQNTRTQTSCRITKQDAAMSSSAKRRATLVGKIKAIQTSLASSSTITTTKKNNDALKWPSNDEIIINKNKKSEKTRRRLCESKHNNKKGNKRNALVPSSAEQQYTKNRRQYRYGAFGGDQRHSSTCSSRSSSSCASTTTNTPSVGSSCASNGEAYRPKVLLFHHQDFATSAKHLLETQSNSRRRTTNSKTNIGGYQRGNWEGCVHKRISDNHQEEEQHHRPQRTVQGKSAEGDHSVEKLRTIKMLSNNPKGSNGNKSPKSPTEPKSKNAYLQLEEAVEIRRSELPPQSSQQKQGTYEEPSTTSESSSSHLCTQNSFQLFPFKSASLREENAENPDAKRQESSSSSSSPSTSSNNNADKNWTGCGMGHRSNQCLSGKYDSASQNQESQQESSMLSLPRNASYGSQAVINGNDDEHGNSSVKNRKILSSREAMLDHDIDPMTDLGYWKSIVAKEKQRNQPGNATSFRLVLANMIVAKNESMERRTGLLWLPSILEGHFDIEMNLAEDIHMH